MNIEKMIQNNDEWETEEEETTKGRNISKDFCRPAYFGTSIQQRQIGKHKYE